MRGERDFVNLQLIELNKRVGVMISLLLRIIPAQEKVLSLKEQVKLLADLGIRPRDIADILGRSPTYINKELTVLRKKHAEKVRGTDA